MTTAAELVREISAVTATLETGFSSTPPLVRVCRMPPTTRRRARLMVDSLVDPVCRRQAVPGWLFSDPVDSSDAEGVGTPRS